ncbi:MAG: YceI family protein [Nitritalea sp.]
MCDRSAANSLEKDVLYLGMQHVNFLPLMTLAHPQQILYSLLVSFLLLLGSAQRSFTQQTYSLATDKSTFQVAGTSTIHDWSLTGKKGSGTLELEVEKGDLKKIAPFTLRLETKSLKSDQEKNAMTEKAHKSLQAEKHRYIQFEAKKVEILSSERLRVEGTWTIAGAKSNQAHELDYTLDESFQVSGTAKLKFSDFNLDPPTALLGSIRVRDETEIKLELTFNKKD